MMNGPLNGGYMYIYMCELIDYKLLLYTDVHVCHSVPPVISALTLYMHSWPYMHMHMHM